MVIERVGQQSGQPREHRPGCGCLSLLALPPERPADHVRAPSPNSTRSCPSLHPLRASRHHRLARPPTQGSTGPLRGAPSRKPPTARRARPQTPTAARWPARRSVTPHLEDMFTTSRSCKATSSTARGVDKLRASSLELHHQLVRPSPQHLPHHRRTRRCDHDGHGSQGPHRVG